MILYFLLVAVLFSANKVCGQNPEIVDEIWTEVQPVGRTGRLNCTVARLQQNVVSWIHIKSRRTISMGESIEVINEMIGGLKKYEVRTRYDVDRVTHMLVIRRLRLQDAGLYLCQVRIPSVAQRDWPGKLGKLDVQVAPTIRFGATTSVLQVDKGKSASLFCGAFGNPYPNITWTRLDGNLLPVAGNPVAQYRAVYPGELRLVNVDVKHMGVYRCVADNNIKPAAQALSEVLIFHAPMTRVVQNSVGQAANRRFHAKLECIVQGHPEPTVTWERLVNNGLQRIIDNDDYDINKQTTDNQNLKAMEQWYTLKVKNIQPGDYTDYRCIATNKFGSTYSVITLFETTECQGPNCPSLPASRTVNVMPSFVCIVLALFSFTWFCLH